jgi:transcription elongation factor GreA
VWYYSAAMAESMKDRLIKKFEDEIQTLNHELKLELPKEIKRARELGDLRENAEYAAAKERQRLVEARISMLQKRVSEIALLNVDRIPKDRAGFGSTVHVVEGNGDKLTFQLVMPEDADAAKGLISTTSPIGKAFLNKEEGDSVKVTTPGGTRQFEIVKLQTIHDEAAG